MIEARMLNGNFANTEVRKKMVIVITLAAKKECAGVFEPDFSGKKL